MNTDSQIPPRAWIKLLFPTLTRVLTPFLLFWLCVVFCWALVSAGHHGGSAKSCGMTEASTLDPNPCSSLPRAVVLGRLRPAETTAGDVCTKLSGTLRASMHQNRTASFMKAGDIPLQGLCLWHLWEPRPCSLILLKYLDAPNSPDLSVCSFGLGRSVCEHHFAFKNSTSAVKIKF